MAAAISAADELTTAVFHGRAAVVRKFITASPEAAMRPELIVLAARASQDAICEMILDSAPEMINARCNETGMTPLMWASANLEAQLVRTLLRRGANPCMQTIRGAQRQGTSADIARLKLESKGSDPSWTRCATECLVLLDDASAAYRLRLRERLRRCFALITILLKWRARAAHRVFAPGGIGYQVCARNFEALQVAES